MSKRKSKKRSRMTRGERAVRALLTLVMTAGALWGAWNIIAPKPAVAAGAPGNAVQSEPAQTSAGSDVGSAAETEADPAFSFMSPGYVLDGEDLRSSIESMIHGVIAPIANGITDEHGHVTAADWNRALNPFLSMIPEAASLRMTEQSIAGHTAEELTERLDQLAMERYRRKEEEFGELPDGSGTPLMREVERVVMLRVVDEYWMDQIDAMAELRQGIGLRAYAQTDPVIAYKKEGYEMFDAMIAAIREETVRRLFTVQLRVNQEVKRERVAQVTGENAGGDGTVKKQPVRRDSKKVGRNEPCPCGSGLKYKKCCGIND